MRAFADALDAVPTALAENLAVCRGGGRWNDQASMSLPEERALCVDCKETGTAGHEDPGGFETLTGSSSSWSLATHVD